MEESSAPASSLHDERSIGSLPKHELTTREKIILLESSKLDGYVYPPWTSPNASEFDTSEFIDAGVLSLSTVQLEVLDDWRRAADIFKATHPGLDLTLTMVADKTIDLVQDVTTDCSIVASLCAASARLTLGKSDVTCHHLQVRFL